ncbi:unnamed protein product, partial [Allacma fusca]
MVSLRSVPVILQLAFVLGLLTEDTSSSGLARPEFVCYHEGLRDDGLSPSRFENAIVDTRGQQCYQPIPKPSFNALFIKASLDEAFATAIAEVCPGWSNSRKCLFRHLNTRCIREQINKFQEDVVFNNYLVLTQLLCEPSKNFSMLNFFKDEVEDDHLGDSPNDDTTRDVECVERFAYITDLYAVPLPDMAPLFFECSIRPVKNYTQGNVTTDLISIDRWARFKKEWLSSHSVIWNQFNASRSV